MAPLRVICIKVRSNGLLYESGRVTRTHSASLMHQAQPDRVSRACNRASAPQAVTLAGTACVLLFLLAGCEPHPRGSKDLLGFLAEGTTTKQAVEQKIGQPFVWGGGRLWTYHIDEDSDGFYLRLKPPELDGTRYSLVLEFDQNGVLRRHALVDIQKKP